MAAFLGAEITADQYQYCQAAAERGQDPELLALLSQVWPVSANASHTASAAHSTTRRPRARHRPAFETSSKVERRHPACSSQQGARLGGRGHVAVDFAKRPCLFMHHCNVDRLWEA